MASRVKRHDSHVAGHFHDLRCHYSQKGPVIHPLVLTGGEPGQQSSPPLDVRTAVRMFELKTSVLGCSVWEGLQPPPSYAPFRHTSLRWLICCHNCRFIKPNVTQACVSSGGKNTRVGWKYIHPWEWVASPQIHPLLIVTRQISTGECGKD